MGVLSQWRRIGNLHTTILILYSLLQQENYGAQKFQPLYLAKQTLMLVSMQIFLDHATKQISMYSNG